MDLATISSFFSQSVPLFVVGLIAHQVYIANEIKHIRKDLSNHITDTNKKIEDLKTETNKQFDNLRQDMKDGFKEIKEAMKAQNSQQDLRPKNSLKVP